MTSSRQTKDTSKNTCMGNKKAPHVNMGAKAFNSLSSPHAAIQRAISGNAFLNPEDIIQLQQTIGNRAVCQLLSLQRSYDSSSEKSSFGSQNVIQKMEIKDFNKIVLGEAQKIVAKPYMAGGWVNGFKDWFSGKYEEEEKIGAFDSTVVEPASGIIPPKYKRMYKTWMEYVQDDYFKPEMLKGYIEEYLAFMKETKDLTGKSQVGDVTVPQGMYLVKTKSEVTGLKTIGVGPCVAVGMVAQGSNGEAYALAHLDGSTIVEPTIEQMIKEVSQAAGQLEPKIDAWMIGGAIQGNNKDAPKSLSGPTLFIGVKNFLYSLDCVKSVYDRHSTDDKGVNVRIGGGESPGQPEIFESTERDSELLNPEYLAKHPKEFQALKVSMQSKLTAAHEGAPGTYDPKKHMSDAAKVIEKTEALLKKVEEKKE